MLGDAWALVNSLHDCNRHQFAQVSMLENVACDMENACCFRVPKDFHEASCREVEVEVH